MSYKLIYYKFSYQLLLFKYLMQSKSMYSPSPLAINNMNKQQREIYNQRHVSPNNAIKYEKIQRRRENMKNNMSSALEMAMEDIDGAQLKLHRYKMNKQNEPLRNEMEGDERRNNQYKNRRENYHREKQSEKQTFKLNERQLRMIQILKLQQVQYVVREHMERGREIREIMIEDVMERLEQWVRNIIIDKESKNDLRILTFAQQLYPSPYEQKLNNKNLQSTAEYWQQSQSKSHQNDSKQFNTPINSFQQKLISQRRRKQLTIEVNDFQSTIKHLKSPYSENSQQLSTGHKKSNEKQVAHIGEFTLGGKDEDQNFTQRENEMNIIEGIQNLNNSIGLRRLRLKQPQVNEVSEFIESQEQKVSCKTYEMLKNKCQISKNPEFNRKIPKGKAIKNRIIGNTDNGKALQ